MAKNFIAIYLAYFKNELIAVGYDKSEIKKYMIKIRGLESDEFSIVKKITDTSAVDAFYGQYLMDTYYKQALPTIDILIIEQNAVTAESTLRSIINMLSVLHSWCDGTDKLEQYETGTKKHIKYYEDILNNSKARRRIDKQANLSHPIMRCNMQDYLYYRKMFLEMRELDNAYRRKLL